MGLIKETNGATVSVASKNGYTKANVIKAKKYLKEIGSDRRNFPIERLVEMYNDVKGTNEQSVGCKPCQATKFYNGLQNYAYFGELTLINNGICTKDELDINKVVEEVKVEEPKEEEKKSDIKERMAKVRAAKGKKNDKD